jgi:hypothetical protein
MTALHENLERTQSLENAPASDRSLGVALAVGLALIAVYPVLSGVSPRWWALVAAAVAGAIAWLRPTFYRLPNRLWFKLGILLAALISPLAIGIVYLITIVPTGLVMQLLKKDPLRLRFDRSASTYWLDRAPPGPDPKDMPNQF